MVRVFVSHCANHDDRSKTVVEHLVSELSDDDIKLVWDRELQVGDEWDDKLLKENSLPEWMVDSTVEQIGKLNEILKESPLYGPTVS